MGTYIRMQLPAYFYSIGLVDYSLYIPMTFDGASIIGSTRWSHIQKASAQQEEPGADSSAFFLDDFLHHAQSHRFLSHGILHHYRAGWVVPGRKL